MAKKRIHQIAKELDIASADILHQAKELGIDEKIYLYLKILIYSTLLCEHQKKVSYWTKNQD